MSIDLGALRERVRKLKMNELKDPGTKIQIEIGQKRDEILERVRLLCEASKEAGGYFPTHPSPITGHISRLISQQARLEQLNKEY